MDDTFSERVSGIGALAEPARRALYEYVVSRPEAVSREAAATGAGVPLHSAKFHLDRLVEQGLLQTEFRRLSGRSGPGAGRPAKLYRRSDHEIAVSLPERHYDLAGQIMARALERAGRDGVAPSEATRAEARDEGLRIAAARPRDGEQVARAAEALAGCGYEPRVTSDEVTLANCPFHALARDHTALVCGMNEALVGGVLEGLDCSDLEAVLEPESGLCCVKARRRSRRP